MMIATPEYAVEILWEDGWHYDYGWHYPRGRLPMPKTYKTRTDAEQAADKIRADGCTARACVVGSPQG